LRRQAVQKALHDRLGRCGWRFPARIAAVALVIVALLVADSLRCAALAHRAFVLSFAGNIGTSTKTVYGTITDYTITWLNKCGSGLTSVVWRNLGPPPTTATRVELNCINNP